ncbi:MAG: hypothetical protein ABSH01_10795 [Terriglobia bacterium]
MVQIQPSISGPIPRYVLMAALLLTEVAAMRAERFYPDDPILSFPKPVAVQKLPSRKTGGLYDFIKQSFSTQSHPAVPARAVNTLGDVPDSEWFTNRHGARRMSRQELQHGPGVDAPPVPPFTVIGVKTEGITPGFQMSDAKGRLYFVKPDPVSNPEMATAADVIGARFFYALGYYTPQNYLVYLRRSDLKVSPRATVDGLGGKKRPMLERDLDDILRIVPRRKDGMYRMMASRSAEGEPIGPFRYEGTRSDDPNDTIPHQDRRDLRGLHVFCAWLNHTDAKSLNSLDTLVEEGGVRFVRHYLIDFGAILGSDSDMAKNARFGNGYIIPKAGHGLTRIVALGMDVRSWESANYGSLNAVGRFESHVFDPEKWKSNYPNPAFLRRLTDDEYWAAKQVMAFTDEDIRAIVETGEYSDPHAVEYITRALIERRNKIGRTYFSKVLPLDNFAVSAGALAFDDLAVKHGFTHARSYRAAWFRFDNKGEQLTPIQSAGSLQLPAEALAADEGAYYAVRIQSDDPRKTVTVYLRKRSGVFKVAGAERTW